MHRRSQEFGRSVVSSRGARRRGMVNFYFVILMVVFIALSALMVDAGRSMVAKGELQATADAAARYAAAGMVNASSNKSTVAYNQALAACNDQRVDGRVASVTSQNVVLGSWDSTTRTFTTVGNENSANAVRVTVTQTLGGSGSTTMFSRILGSGTKTITATSIATAVINSTTITAPSMGNLWLAAAPDNTQITNLQSNTARYDNSGTATTPKQRPQQVLLSSLGLNPGDIVSFAGLDGTGSNGGGSGNTGPDGQTSRNVTLGNSNASSVPNNSANGIANVRAPLAAVMAVFLGDSAPNPASAPACLDFGTAASRDYIQIQPLLHQPFFVGDGQTSTGQQQSIRIPAGATRVYLGMMDAWQWNDNSGSFGMTVNRGTAVTTVK